MCLSTDVVEEVNSYLSQPSLSALSNSQSLCASTASSTIAARSLTLSRLLAVVLQAIQMTANIVYAMLQSIRSRDSSPDKKQEDGISAFPFSLVQKAAPVINDLLPLFVNLCSKIVQSWEKAQAIQKDFMSLRELHNHQEKAGSRPGTGGSYYRSEPMAPRNDLVWFAVDEAFLLSVLVEAAVLMGTIMSLPSVYANISNTSSMAAGGLAESSNYTMNTLAPVALNVLTMSDRW
jgi:hypothetical protein